MCFLCLHYIAQVHHPQCFYCFYDIYFMSFVVLTYAFSISKGMLLSGQNIRRKATQQSVTSFSARRRLIHISFLLKSLTSDYSYSCFLYMDSLSFDIPCFQGSILTDNLPDQIFSGLTPVMQGRN